jgi:hypothetical protein
MDRPLQDHISYLERRLKELNCQLMEKSRTTIEVKRLESEIRAAELALVYYRKAVKLEKRLG